MIKKIVVQLSEDTLFLNSLYLMLSTAVMAGFGFFFWIINARLFTTEDIGLATTLISVMGLIAILSLIGFNASFVRFLPSATDKNDQMNTGIILVGVTSVILAILFIVFVGLISPQLDFIQGSPLLMLAFIVACAMNALNVLTDSIFLSGKRTKYTLIIDTVFSCFKMLAPFAFIGLGAIGIFTAAALAQTLGTILSIGVMIARFDYRPSLTIRWNVLSSVWRYCAANYLAGIFNLLPVTLLPIIVINHLGLDSAAYYYIAMMIANLLYAIPFATTRSLFAEGSNDETTLVENIRKSVRLMVYLLVPAVLILFFGGGLILDIFGKSYLAGGVEFLQILALSAIAVSAYSLVNALFQVRKDINAIIIVNLVYAGAIIGLSYALLPQGLSGIGIAWALGNVLAALVGFALYQWGPHLGKSYENVMRDSRETLLSKTLYLRALARNGFRTRTVLFYPQLPELWHLAYPITHSLGVRMTRDPRARFDAAIAFNDVTVRPDDPVLRKLSLEHEVINLDCLDISKSHVEEIFKEVFGYGMSIDPRTHQGAYVKKSETNAAHDGRILYEPSEPEKGYIYQKLVNNVEDGQAKDIRVFIFRDRITFTFYRYKTLADRFDATIAAHQVDTDAALSAQEQASILRFAGEIGLDYGELDIVRDLDDGRIYIVDANSTPSGPHRGIQIPKEEYDAFLAQLGAAFASAFLSD